ncbi:hypothetical protein [Bradyrhizobium sp. S69]|uniref:hypothetical protein n=1 Tax=Bradyrhizobium sp. S69 TaxID=1641856 RepID=UPI001FEDBDD0|nr:hypothetical protein [Bradyrhizobium sp. S69]
MTSTRRYGLCGLLILAAGIGLAAIGPAGAQIWPKDMKTDPPAAQSGTEPDDADADAADPETPAADSAAAKDGETKDAAVKDADGKPLEFDWSQLKVDPSTLTWAPASKARVAPKPAPGTDAAWSESNKPNGSSDVSVKQSLSAFLDAKVGADMTVTGPPQTLRKPSCCPRGWRTAAACRNPPAPHGRRSPRRARARSGTRRRSKRGSIRRRIRPGSGPP